MFMVVLQNSMDLWKVEHGWCVEMFLTSDDGNEVSDIKAENDTNVQEDGAEPITFPGIKDKREVSLYMCVLHLITGQNCLFCLSVCLHCTRVLW
jgi:hypothetical protein